jgi:hypothetical protein
VSASHPKIGCTQFLLIGFIPVGIMNQALNRLMKGITVTCSGNEGKKMEKQALVIGLFFLFILIGLSGCQEDDMPLIKIELNKLYGTWNTNTSDGQVWTFQTTKELSVVINGTRHSEGTFDVTNVGYLRLFNEQVPYNYTFSNNDLTLRLLVSGENNGHPTALLLTKNATYTPTPSYGGPHYEVTAIHSYDNFARVSSDGYTGMVWVNLSITNTGESGQQEVLVELYGGRGNYSNCTVFDSNFQQTTYLEKGESTTLYYSFEGVPVQNHTGCYGLEYKIY